MAKGFRKIFKNLSFGVTATTRNGETLKLTPDNSHLNWSEDNLLSVTIKDEKGKGEDIKVSGWSEVDKNTHNITLDNGTTLTFTANESSSPAVSKPDTSKTLSDTDNIEFIETTENAFNQYGSLSYQYQYDDIRYVGLQLVNEYNTKNTVKLIDPIANGADLGGVKINAVNILKKAETDLNKNHKVIGVFNTNGNHWIAYVLFKHEGQIKCLYKDSLGKNCKDFEMAFKGAFHVDVDKKDMDKLIKVANTNIEQKMEFEPLIAVGAHQHISCGVFALKNMIKLAGINPSHFNSDGIEFFEAGNNQEDYNRSILEARKQLAEKYLSSRIEDIRTEELREAIPNAHKTETEELHKLIGGGISLEKIDVIALHDNPRAYQYKIECEESDNEKIGHIESKLKKLGIEYYWRDILYTSGLKKVFFIRSDKLEHKNPKIKILIDKIEVNTKAFNENSLNLNICKKVNDRCHITSEVRSDAITTLRKHKIAEIPETFGVSLSSVSTSHNSNNRSLDKHGLNNPHYCYSVYDAMKLLAWIRKEYLNSSTTDPRKKFTTYEDQSRIFVANPYPEQAFRDYFEKDIKDILYITRDSIFSGKKWGKLPTKIIIPLLDSSYWRVIVITINYDDKATGNIYEVNIFLDDPLGKGKFSKDFQDKIINIVSENVQKLIRVETGDKDPTPSIILYVKDLNQLGGEKGSWDSGTIAISNIEDYVISGITEKEVEYSVPPYSADNHKSIISKTREKDISRCKEIFDENLDNEKLKQIKTDIIKSQAAWKGKLESTDGYNPQLEEVSKWPSLYIDMFVTVIENKSLAEPSDSSKGNYRKEEITYAYQLVLDEMRKQQEAAKENTKLPLSVNDLFLLAEQGSSFAVDPIEHRFKPLLSSVMSIDMVLYYLLNISKMGSWKGIGILAIKINNDFPAFKEANTGIDWRSLAKLPEVFSSDNVFAPCAYYTLPKLIEYALHQKEIQQELDNFNKVIEHIIKTKNFYKQTEPVTQHLTALVRFATDLAYLFRLKKLLEMVDIGSLTYQLDNHTIESNTPQPYSIKKRSGDFSNKVENFDSIGRIHIIMTIAWIGEVIIQLSPQARKYFSHQLLDNFKEARNIAFHPEREIEWSKIGELIHNQKITKKGSEHLNFILEKNLENLVLEILRNYEVAAEVFHFLAGRKWERDYIPGYEISDLFGNEENFQKIVIDKIPSRLYNLYFEYNKYIVNYDYYIECCIQYNHIPCEILWDHIKSGLGVVTPISLQSKPLIEEIEEYFKKKLQCINSLAFHKINKQDLDLLYPFFRDHSFKLEHLKKDYKSLEYHVNLQGKISSEEELYNILKILPESSYSDTQRDISDDLINTEIISIKQYLYIPLEKIKQWSHLKKLLLIKSLLKCDQTIKSQEGTLSKYKEHYETALGYKEKLGMDVPPSSPFYVKGILTNYPTLRSKYADTQKSHEVIVSSILLVDYIAQKAFDLHVLMHAKDTILPRLLFSLEKINYYYNLSKNPSPMMAFTNSVNPTYSSLEFFAVVAGSLIRAYNCNTILSELGKQSKDTLDTLAPLSHIMEKLQEIRGLIAHMYLPKPGQTLKLASFPYLEWNKYAKACYKALQDVLRLDIPEKIKDILFSLENIMSKNVNFKEDIKAFTIITDSITPSGCSTVVKYQAEEYSDKHWEEETIIEDRLKSLGLSDQLIRELSQEEIASLIGENLA